MTWRRLWRMVRGRQQAEWGRTSALLAAVHNAGFGCQELANPDDFNPFAPTPPAVAEREETPEEHAESMAMLRQAIAGE